MTDHAIDLLQAVRDVKTDLGALYRAGRFEQLDEETFLALTRRMRLNLNALEAELADRFEEVELSDAGAALGRLLDAGVIQPGAALLDRGPDRARAYGRLAVIDGGRAFDGPPDLSPCLSPAARPAPPQSPDSPKGAA